MIHKAHKKIKNKKPIITGIQQIKSDAYPNIEKRKNKRKNKNKEEQGHHELKTHNHEFQQIKSDAYPNIKQRKKCREANFHHHRLKTHHHGKNPNIKQPKKKGKKKN